VITLNSLDIPDTCGLDHERIAFTWVCSSGRHLQDAILVRSAKEVALFTEKIPTPFPVFLYYRCISKESVAFDLVFDVLRISPRNLSTFLCPDMDDKVDNQNEEAEEMDKSESVHLRLVVELKSSCGVIKCVCVWVFVCMMRTYVRSSPRGKSVEMVVREREGGAVRIDSHFPFKAVPRKSLAERRHIGQDEYLYHLTSLALSCMFLLMK
jgi:hypothetical protein